MEKVKKLSEIAQKNLKLNPWKLEKDIYYIFLQGVIDEVEEVRAEIKDNNQARLEDELGDILWDYLMLVFSLARDKKISSPEKVWERAIEKYQARLGPSFIFTEKEWDQQDIKLLKNIYEENWAKAKKKQKQKLEK